MQPKYPQIVVPLTGEDGNCFAILGRVLRAMRQAGVPTDEQMAFRQEATAGDYEHLLGVVMQWVDVE
jgi:hypothetical protein